MRRCDGELGDTGEPGDPGKLGDPGSVWPNSSDNGSLEPGGAVAGSVVARLKPQGLEGLNGDESGDDSVPPSPAITFAAPA